MRRRIFLATASASLAMPRLSLGADARVLRIVPQADLPTLDPIWTTATVVRNHGYMVFDTLYGMDADFNMQPQMLAGHVVEDDGLTWKLTLRDGLAWHDGTKVLARDCAASIRRFCARDSFGSALIEATNELVASDDRTLTFRLKKRFPLLPNALGKPGTAMPAMMPEHLALTDPNRQVTEMIGSGPYRFLANERVAGASVAYQKNQAYVPRADGKPTFTAGPKRAFFERVEWQIVPDAATQIAALLNGEVDWVEEPAADLLGQLKSNRKVVTEPSTTGGGIGIMGLNFLYPPFDNPAIRRALLGAFDQTEFMTGSLGEDRSLWSDREAVFSPDSPMDSKTGLEVMTSKRDLPRVRQELIAAGYKGEKVILLGAVDYAQINALSQIAEDLLKRLGMNVELQNVDWSTAVQRRASRKPPAEGGWNAFFTNLNGTNNFDPAAHLGLRGNGDKAWFGWPTMPRMEELRQAWFDAPDLAAQKRICAEIERQFWIDVPYIPLGCRFTPTVYSATLTQPRMGFVQGYDVARRG